MDFLLNNNNNTLVNNNTKLLRWSVFQNIHYKNKPGHWSSVPAICCSTETDRSTMPSEDVRLSCVFGGKSVSLECVTGQSERSRADFRHFQASFQDLLLHVMLDVSHVRRIRNFFW